jgi:DNA-binding MarR family transcriptional regulator
VINFDQSITFLLGKVATAHRNILERSLNAAGLHSGQAFLLMALWEQDGLRQTDLAEALNVAPPTVNKILSGMVEKGFVTRGKYEGDARSSRVYLTDQGRAIRSAVEKQWQALESRILEDLTETERLILPQLLVKLLENYLDR